MQSGIPVYWMSKTVISASGNPSVAMLTVLQDSRVKVSSSISGFTCFCILTAAAAAVVV